MSHQIETAMRVRRRVLPDGRYLIFFEFEEVKVPGEQLRDVKPQTAKFEEE